MPSQGEGKVTGPNFADVDGMTLVIPQTNIPALGQQHIAEHPREQGDHWNRCSVL